MDQILPQILREYFVDSRQPRSNGPRFINSKTHHYYCLDKIYAYHNEADGLNPSGF